MTKTHAVVEALTAEMIGAKIRIRGWIRTRRGSGSFSFLEVNDGSCMSNLQVIADQDLPNYESEIGHLTTGCSVTVEGEIKDSPGKQPTEMHASKIVVHGWAKDYPLQKKRHSFEKLREWAHLRARTNTFGAAARVRNQVSMSIHNAFQEEGFLYLHTPIITASDCEGAGEMFRVAKLDLDGRKAIQAVQDGSLDFFDRPSYLTVSGQLEAEIYATALSKVYTFGPTFRAENSNTSRHLSEFWMVEPEVAFYELTDNMDLAERFLKRLFRDALENSAEDMRFFADQNIRIAAQKTKGKQQNKNQTHPFVGVDVIARLAQIIDSEFVRLPYTEAIEILTSSGQPFEFPVEWGVDLQSEHERYLTETKFGRPVIVYDYPATIKPFYMRVNDGGKTVRAMDVLVPGVGEIIGGSQREERLDVIEQRMQTQGLKVDDYWWYTDLRRYGTVPHAGFGLGLERVIQFITGLSNIRDVIPFPRTPGTAEF